MIVGADANQASGFSGEGLWALRAATGLPVWHFNPEALLHRPLYGCGNVWSSPALDVVPGAAHPAMVFAGFSDCPDNRGTPCPPAAVDPACPPGGYDYAHRWTPYSEAIVGVDAATGAPVWSYQRHTPLNTLDDDYGSSAQAFSLPGVGRVVGEGNKDGFYSVLRRDDGTPVWSRVEQGNGNVTPSLAIGGFIGSTTVARAGRRTVIAGASAIDTPFTYDPRTGRPVPQPGPEGPLAGRTPMRAFDAATGAPLWQRPQAFAYGASSSANGVVYVGALDGLLRAYSASTGRLLWAFPLSGPVSSSAAIAGSTLVVGAGTSENAPAARPLDRLNGVWAFSPLGV